jgi:hypothetical protein
LASSVGIGLGFSTALGEGGSTATIIERLPDPTVGREPTLDEAAAFFERWYCAMHPFDPPTPCCRPTALCRVMRSRIMYIENKAGGLSGPARIGRVSFSKTGKTLYYRGRAFQSLKGMGFKANYFDVESGEEYWISGCKRDGSDRLYGERIPVEIDEDVRAEYWTEIRQQPEKKATAVAN